MGEFADQLSGVAALVARAAAEQGGVISGDNPTTYSDSNPFRLWVIQVVIIISFSQILALGLGRIRQPRVIAEVIGGILLGPTVMGRIPNFKNTIFPTPSMPLLNLTSTIGLILFLFLVALEIDTRLLKRSVKVSAAVSIGGLVIPLGLGAALGVGVYREFISPNYPDVNFGHFLLFTAVAIGITAFPVLCRILTECKLLETQVGVIVLSAGIGNDVVGWILLALVVALVNASNGLTALYVLLASVGYTVFLLYPVKWAFHWLARRTGSLEQGTPTPFMMTVTLLTVFISAFFTDIIGVHSIFGGFLAGLIIPHDNGFAISLVEKIEDLVTILFIPIYFTLSGLRTNLGLLNDGVTWGYTIIICLVAFFAKFIPCAGAAYFFGFPWRESGAIGSLMSCKGLVELIVLNIGLQAGILDDRTFSMFVVHALVLTFVTTPLTLAFYPAKYRNLSTLHGVKGGQGRQADPESHPEEKGEAVADADLKTRFTLVLDKIEQLAPAMAFSQLLIPNGGASSQITSTTSLEDTKENSPAASPSGPTHSITIDTLRLIELTNRTSAVIKSQEADALIYNDPIISVYSTFGSLNHLSVSASLSVVNFEEFPESIADHVANANSEMVIIPWARGSTSILSSEDDVIQHEVSNKNPFDQRKTSTQDQTGSAVYGEFIRSVFLKSPKDVALFVDRGATVGTSSARGNQHLFLPFFGGPDDRLALNFIVQLASRASVKATVVRIQKAEDADDTQSVVDNPASPVNAMTVAAADTVYGAFNTQTRLASDTADNLIWEKYTNPSSHDLAPSVRAVLSKISFTTKTTAKPLHTAVEVIQSEITAGLSAPSPRSFVVLVGRSRRMAVEPLGGELKKLVSKLGAPLGSSVPKTLGDVGAALVASNVDASLLVLQSASASVN